VELLAKAVDIALQRVPDRLAQRLDHDGAHGESAEDDDDPEEVAHHTRRYADRDRLDVTSS